MKTATLPVAVIAALLFPRIKQELEPRDEVSQLEKSVARQQNAKKEFEKLLAQVRGGEKVSLGTLFPKSTSPVGTRDEQALLALRQDVVALQEELEELSHGASAEDEPEESEEASHEKAPETSKRNPLVKPDRVRLGRAQFQAGQFAEALVTLSDQNDPWSGFLAACCKERLGQIDEAIAAFEKVADTFEKTPAGKQARASSEYLKKRGKLGKISDYDAQLAEMAAELLQNSPQAAPATSGIETKK